MYPLRFRPIDLEGRAKDPDYGCAPDPIVQKMSETIYATEAEYPASISRQNGRIELSLPGGRKPESERPGQGKKVRSQASDAGSKTLTRLGTMILRSEPR